LDLESVLLKGAIAAFALDQRANLRIDEEFAFSNGDSTDLRCGARLDRHNNRDVGPRPRCEKAGTRLVFGQSRKVYNQGLPADELSLNATRAEVPVESLIDRPADAGDREGAN
jgi:hypothetical protein